MRKIIIFLFFILHNTNNFCQSNNCVNLKMDLSKYYEEEKKIEKILSQMPSSFVSNLKLIVCHLDTPQETQSLKNINEYYYECVEDFIMQIKSNLKKHFSNVNLGKCEKQGKEEKFYLLDYIKSSNVDKKVLGKAGLCWEENKNYIEKKLEEISKINPAISTIHFYYDELRFTSFYKVTKDGKKMVDNCGREEVRLAPKCLYEIRPLYPNCEEELNKNELGLFEIFVGLSNNFSIRLPVCNKFGHIGNIKIILYTEPFKEYCRLCSKLHRIIIMVPDPGGEMQTFIPEEKEE